MQKGGEASCVRDPGGRGEEPGLGSQDTRYRHSWANIGKEVFFFFWQHKKRVTRCWHFLPPKIVVKAGRQAQGYHKQGCWAKWPLRSLLTLGIFFVCFVTASSLSSCLVKKYLPVSVLVNMYSLHSLCCRVYNFNNKPLIFASNQGKKETNKQKRRGEKKKKKKKNAGFSVLNEAVIGVICFEVCKIQTHYNQLPQFFFPLNKDVKI